MLTFTEYGSEVVTVVSICKRADDKPTGTGTQLRYCVGSQDMDYLKYDGMFHIIRQNESFDTTVTVAVERLMYPYGLTQQPREEYGVYLKERAEKAARKFIREDAIDKLKFITEEGFLEKSEVDHLIDLCISMDKTEYTAFLMDYRHKSFSMAEEDFVL